MGSRRPRPNTVLSEFREQPRYGVLERELNFGLLERASPTRLLTIHTFLPRSMAYQARRKVYTYPSPFSQALQRRTLRYNLRLPRDPLVKAKVRIRVPTVLPTVRGSYVSLSTRNGRMRLNVHSQRQHRAALAAGETNRRRYQEGKRARRYASHGQLESRGARRFGLVAASYARGESPRKIADAALVARAIGRW